MDPPGLVFWMSLEFSSNGVTLVITPAYVVTSKPSVGSGPLWHAVQLASRIGLMSFTYVRATTGAVTVTVVMRVMDPLSLLARSV